MEIILKNTLPAEQIKTYMRISDGRDKSIKIVQYFLKLVLAWNYVSKKSHPQLHPRVTTVASNLSKTRKILRLLHFVEPWIALRDTYNKGQVPTVDGMMGVGKSALAQMPPRERFLQVLGFVNTVIEICNDAADDIVCLSKIGALDKKWADRFDPISTNLWMISLVIDLSDNYSEMQNMVADLQRKQLVAREALINAPDQKSGADLSEAPKAAVNALKHKLFIQQLSFVKLLCDFSFNWVDVFGIEGPRAEKLQAAAGFCAALISAYKIWIKSK